MEPAKPQVPGPVTSPGRISRSAKVPLTRSRGHVVAAPAHRFHGTAAEAMALSSSLATLPLWQHSEDYPAGNPYTYTMIGGNPFTAGAGTTTISTPVIAIQFVDSSNTVISDASQPASDCGSTQSAVGLTLTSPMFENSVPDPEKTQRQWVDALQRANFNQQTKTGGISPNYHTLLSGSTPFVLQIHVPDADISENLGNSCGIDVGISDTWFEPVLQNAVSNLDGNGTLKTNTLPIFIMYNTYLCPGGTCSGSAILGFHSLQQDGQGLQIYGIFDYDLTGDWNNGFPLNTGTMSHELAEAFNDPLGINAVPTWGYIGQTQGSCQNNLEPGDPLSASFPGSPSLVLDTYNVGGNPVQYFLQDMAFHSWFFRESTPTSAQVANADGAGNYSIFGQFTTFSDATVCPGQPTGVTATVHDNDQVTVSWTAGPGPLTDYWLVPYVNGAVAEPDRPPIHRHFAQPHRPDPRRLLHLHRDRGEHELQRPVLSLRPAVAVDRGGHRLLHRVASVGDH